MKNSRLDKESKTVKKSGFLSLRTFVVLGVVLTALIGIGTLSFSESSKTGVVSAQSPIDRQGGKKFIATKKIIVDRQTGEIRKPTDAELDELVKTLQTATKRPEENLTSTKLPNGAVSIDMDGGYAGTMLARPNPDGTMETRCVFTFEEAALFLGLEEDNSQQ